MVGPPPGQVSHDSIGKLDADTAYADPIFSWREVFDLDRRSDLSPAGRLNIEGREAPRRRTDVDWANPANDRRAKSLRIQATHGSSPARSSPAMRPAVPASSLVIGCCSWLAAAVGDHWKFSAIEMLLYSNPIWA
jgi:hypothetical protein